MKRDDLVLALESIGWKKHSKMNGYAYNFEDCNGNISNILLKNEEILIKEPNTEVCFMYKDCSYQILDSTCVSLVAKNNDSVFINFYGYK